MTKREMVPYLLWEVIQQGCQGEGNWNTLVAVCNFVIDAAKEEIATELLSPSERGDVQGEEE